MELAETLRNPFFTIWTKPRSTIRQIILAGGAHRSILLVAAAAEISAIVAVASGSRVILSWGGQPLALVNSNLQHMLNLGMIIGAPLFAIEVLFLNSMFVRWAGKLIGGRGKPAEVRAAFAWSTVPAIVSALLYAIAVAAGWASVPQDPEVPNLFRAIAEQFTGINAVFGVLSLWSLVILIEGLSEVHGFSIWKALAARVLGFVAMFVPIAAAGAIIAVPMLVNLHI